MAEVDVQFAAARGRIAFGHVLTNHVRRLSAGDKDGAEVADERLDDVALLEVERVRGRHRFTFLAERAIQTADDFRLAKKRDEPLLERARESQVIIDFQKLIAAKAFRHGWRRASYHRND